MTGFTKNNITPQGLIKDIYKTYESHIKKLNNIKTLSNMNYFS